MKITHNLYTYFSFHKKTIHSKTKKKLQFIQQNVGPLQKILQNITLPDQAQFKFHQYCSQESLLSINTNKLCFQDLESNTLAKEYQVSHSTYYIERLFHVYMVFSRFIGYLYEFICCLHDKDVVQLMTQTKERINLCKNILNFAKSIIKLMYLEGQFLIELNKGIQEIESKIKEIYRLEKNGNIISSRIFKNFSNKKIMILKIAQQHINYEIKVLNSLKLYFQNPQHEQLNQNEENLTQIQNRISKNLVAQYIQEYITEKENLKYACLNCERSFQHSKLLKHARLCKKKYEQQQMLEKNFKQIIPKLQDLNGILTKLQMLYKQKSKTKATNRHKGVVQDKRSKFAIINKRLSKSNNFSQRNQYEEGSEQETDREQKNPIAEEENHESLEQKKKQIETLNQNELKELIKIIQKLQAIGQKVKTSRQTTNLLLYYDLRDVKNTIQEKFNKANIKCTEVSDMIALFSERYLILESLKKNNNKAKQSGFDAQEQYSSLQNIQITQIHTEPKKQMKFKRKKYREADDIYFSEEETPSPSSRFFEDNRISLDAFEITSNCLGHGKYASVHLVKKKTTQQLYAMKKIKIQNYNEFYQSNKLDQNLVNQQCVFQITNSPFVVKAFYSFSQDDYHYFIMEYCPNGDLAELLKNEIRLTEEESKLYMAEIVEALDYLHKKQIIHRDLKPHNIVLDDKWHIKLTDYGLSDAGINIKIDDHKLQNLSKFAQQSRRLKKPIDRNSLGIRIVGSPCYMAPQVMDGYPATYMSDWWSFGVIVYQCLMGEPPFLGKNKQQIRNKIDLYEIWPPQLEFGNSDQTISEDAKNLIEGLLCVDPKKRLGNNVDEIKNHPFFQGTNWKQLLNTEPPMLENRFNKQQKQEQSIKVEIYSQTKSNKSISRSYLVRRDLLNNDMEAKYKSREATFEKLRSISKRLQSQGCKRLQQ